MIGFYTYVDPVKI